ncbi:MAG: hypothetical protein Q9216_003473 [Gyalolechia sp. 2 TL-2023]
MAHAEASNFPASLSKREVYTRLLTQAEALFQGERNWKTLIRLSGSNLANAASLIYHALKSLPTPSNQVNWAGFYILDPTSSSSSDQERERQLILGPFMGKVACQRIQFHRGVCGTAAAEERTVRVDDVDTWPGHIACDGDSRSEIVVPMMVGGTTVGVIDIDCAAKNGFDEVDEEGLERLAALVAGSCDWSAPVSPLNLSDNGRSEQN